MRWFWILVVGWAFWVSARTQCEISDFYGLAWTLHNPSERGQRLSQWLTTNGDACTAEQLVLIWNNLGEWAGSADSAEIRSKVLYYYARAVEREKR